MFLFVSLTVISENKGMANNNETIRLAFKYFSEAGNQEIQKCSKVSSRVRSYFMF